LDSRTGGRRSIERGSAIKKEFAMPIKPELLKALNEEAQNVPIAEERWPELAVELNQLRTAAEAALKVHDFDRDPADFQVVLRARRA
jgi:hypothetical protein